MYTSHNPRFDALDGGAGIGSPRGMGRPLAYRHGGYYLRGLGAASDPAEVAKMVETFERQNFLGQKWVFGPGVYVHTSGAFKDNKISSVRVPAGLEVTLWEHGDASKHGGSFGRSLTIRGPKEVPSLVGTFNDIASRIEVKSIAGGGASAGAEFRAVSGAQMALCLASVPVHPMHASFESCAAAGWPDSAACNDLINQALSTYPGATLAAVRARLQQYGCGAAPAPTQPGTVPAGNIVAAQQALCAAPEVSQSIIGKRVTVSANACAQNGWRKASDINQIFEPFDWAQASACDGFLNGAAASAGVNPDELRMAMMSGGCPSAAPPPVPGDEFVGPPMPYADYGGDVFVGPPAPESNWQMPPVSNAGMGTVVGVAVAAAAIGFGLVYLKKRKGRAKA